MSIHRSLRHGATAVAVCTSLAVVVPAVATATTPVPALRTVLVLVKSSHATSDSVGSRAPLVGQASIERLAEREGIAVLARTSVPDTLTLRLTATQAAAFARDPLVASVLPEVAIPGPANPAIELGQGGSRGHPAATAASCGTFRHPELDPEALTAINDVPGTTLGFDGKGVKVAFLADGLQIANRDFTRNRSFASAASPAGSPVITQYRDFSGDGTAAKTAGGEAFLDASSIAAQGNTVYDLSQAVSPAHPLPSGCDVRIVGAAPGATVDALKIFSESNISTSSGFVQAIDWAVSHGVNVINESFGGNGFPDTATDIVRAADEAAVAAGVTVVVSSGDAGITSTIGSPATDPAVLSVGASTTFRAYQQDTFGGINLPGERDRYVDDNISALSSGGFAQDGKTVDLVAPGDLNWALCANSSMYSDCNGKRVQVSGGTSESSPLTAGAAADVIEAYRASHHGVSPTPAMVMQILTSSATDLASPADQQGAGLLNVGAAVRLALSAPGTTRAARQGGLLASVSQADLAGAPSTTVSQSVTLTNTDDHTASVALSTRSLVPTRVTSGEISLDPSVKAKLPTFPIWSGALEVYRTLKLKVGRGVGRIQLQAGYEDLGQSSLLHVALFTPSGALAGYSNPQGLGDFSDVEVARPAPGTWTAGFFTVLDGFHGESGTSGRVPYTFTQLAFSPLGTVTPSSLTLAPGASGTFDFSSALPADPGDSAASIVLRTVDAGSTTPATVTSIPVTMRTLIALGAGGGHFSGVLTGGNGRGGTPGQSNTYEFVVPSGENDLDVSVAMQANLQNGIVPADQLIGMLEDPLGDVVAYDTNFTVSSAGQVQTRFLNLYRANPVAGTWQLLLDWAQPGTGARTSIPFTGSVAFDQVSVVANLPDAVSAQIPQSGASYTVMVHNTGVAPMILSPDARLSTTVAMTLNDAQGVAATQPLIGAYNSYYVPTETTSLKFDESASVPATFDASFAPGDPDLSPLVASPFATESWSPTSASLSYAPPDGVSAGLWNVVQDGVGPYPRSGEPIGTETTTAIATTRAFDPAVKLSVPDTVEALTAGTPFNPDLVAAGATDTISISITPTAPVGTTVSGTLFLDGFTPGSALTGTIALTATFTNELDAIPYEYTVSS
jgi:Subtilase family